MVPAARLGVFSYHGAAARIRLPIGKRQRRGPTRIATAVDTGPERWDWIDRGEHLVNRKRKVIVLNKLGDKSDRQVDAMVKELSIDSRILEGGVGRAPWARRFAASGKASCKLC